LGGIFGGVCGCGKIIYAGLILNRDITRKGGNNFGTRQHAFLVVGGLSKTITFSVLV
jgi:hypothetical protein